ncbi:MAG TPA: hypothetical protein VFT64_09775 [Rickettsiales bacterium]|nr:hypothetical protein [Rickettsiales bacterium]
MQVATETHSVSNGHRASAGKTPAKGKSRIATMKDAAVAAAVEGRFRFATEQQAQEALDKICSRFIISKDSPAPNASGKHTEIKIWIRGYDVTEEEKEKGARGNYALIKIKRVNGGRYALLAEKLHVDVGHHPEKERPKTRHPNWGHPVLRAVLAEKKFDTLEKAYSQLMALHYEYPETTIPGADTLHVMVYSHKTDHSMPIERVVIKIKVLSEGGVQLSLKGKGQKKTEMKEAPPLAQKIEAAYAAKPATQVVEHGDEAVEAPSKPGRFTSMVVQRRKKRAPVRKPTTSES